MKRFEFIFLLLCFILIKNSSIAQNVATVKNAGNWAIALHGGAGSLSPNLSPEKIKLEESEQMIKSKILEGEVAHADLKDIILLPHLSFACMNYYRVQLKMRPINVLWGIR